MTGRKRMHGVPQSAIDGGLSFPYLTFVSMPFYHDRRQLSKVTCIQMTETKLFFVWDAMYKPEHIDFFRRLGMIPGGTPPPHGPGDDGDVDGGTGDGGTEAGTGDGGPETQVVLASGSGVLIEDLLDETAVAGPSTETVHAQLPIDIIDPLEQGEDEDTEEEAGAEGAAGAGEENAGEEDSDDNNTDDSDGSDTGDDSDDDDDWHAPPQGGDHPLDDIGRDRELSFCCSLSFSTLLNTVCR